MYIAQNHNHIASMGFTSCTVNDILCPSSLDSSEEKPCHVDGKKDPFNRVKKQNKKKTMEETSGRATEEGPLFQVGQTCNRCRMCRKEQQISLQVTLTQSLIQSMLTVSNIKVY